MPFGRRLLFSALSGSFEARATDLDEMGRLLTPAYTAMSLAGVCSAAPGWQERQPRGLRGVAIHYAEHVKDEMIEGLTHDEAVAVLRFAAERARDEARQQLHRHVYTEDHGSARNDRLVAGAATLAWSGAPTLASLIGPLAVVGACVMWGLDNNLTRKVSLADPLQIVQFKGLIAGPVNLALGLLAGAPLPDALDTLLSGVVGLDMA